ncbi:lysine-tRNA ligase [Cyphellophora europaea CBS 101466]|uniref:Lysine-tRNA ligase n=1 Tax=Cyphellophora europaea (strain CBS 101466) TaxID=1220924 RepID=W2SBF0_CYPE1|nr:lysine-tRNA ligase [Cyphellophora europaea CBS 101466]ETN45348.1 lysine-tRNA ligase [Cyphellophora europaea CBS 101466]
MHLITTTLKRISDQKQMPPALRLLVHSQRNLSTRPYGGLQHTAQYDDFTSKEVKERITELEHARVAPYPRWSTAEAIHDLRTLKNTAEPSSKLKPLQAIRHRVQVQHGDKDSILSQETPVLQVAGRITATRFSGKRLAFFDITGGGGEVLQIKLNLAELADVTLEAFRDAARLFRRGDHITVRGSSYTTKTGQRSLQAVELPVLRAPCLQRLPVPQALSERDLDHDSTSGRHVEMLTYPDLVKTVKVRSLLIQTLRRMLEEDDFVEVQTPILGAESGGATARPFLTAATEFTDRRLSLRIAPELWLKRLLVGGLTEVFEIGPSFRNEGLDKTHNPEFTTCEFYAAHLNLGGLVTYTEGILNQIADSIEAGAPAGSFDSAIVSEWQQCATQSFPQLDFVPAINAALQTPLPSLTSPTARTDLMHIFRDKSIPMPDIPTLPRLLDKLSSHYLEPQCHTPTWIINTPECLSPLSKSFIHPTAPNHQPVAARAELFIRGKEIVNCYEEENSPFEQRRKFIDQQKYARVEEGDAVDDEAMKVDEDYIGALEWGLPPTGGWGCGIDRLVMLVTGRDRIGDVLSFGNLRAVTKAAQRLDKRKTERQEAESDEEIS